MGRRIRNDIEGGWHHVMNRGAAHQQTFFDQRDGLDFERRIAEASERYGVEVHAHCLMPNHFHLLLHCPEGGMGRFVQYLTGTYTRWHNERVRRDGALFRGRYHSVEVTDDRQVITAARYICRNPISLRRPEPPHAYRWSSFGAYVGQRATPVWLHTDVVLGLTGGGRRAFRELVEDDQPTPLPTLDPLEFINLLVDEASANGVADQGQRAGRLIATSILHLLPPLDQQRLVTALGFDDAKAIERARRHADERLAKSPDLRVILEHVIRVVRPLTLQLVGKRAA